jgi:MoxR-like ATPase
MYVKVGYPAAAYESQIVELARSEALQTTKVEPASHITLTQNNIFAARKQVLNLFMSPALLQYLVELVLATRSPERYGDDLKSWIRHGASPRATIALDRAARAHAWLQKREFVTPEDIQAVAHDVLRHRIILSYSAMAEGMTTDEVIHAIISRVAIP